MKSVLRVGGAMLALVTLAIACADTDEPALVDERIEGGALPPASDATTELDASTDGDAAPPRECSNDGFCHTPVPANQTLRGVWGDGADTVWTVSAQGSVLRWDGTQWNVHVERLGLLTTIWGSSPTDVWIGGQEGLFHGTGATPATLTFVRTPELTGEVISVWGQSATDVWAVLVDLEGSHIVHYATGDAGLSWSTVSVGAPDSRFSRVWGSAGTGVWIAAMSFDPETFTDRGDVYRMRPGSETFETVPMPGHPFHDGPYWAFGEVSSTTMVGDTHMVLQARAVSFDALIIRGGPDEDGGGFTFAAEPDRMANTDGYDDPQTNSILAFSPNDLWTAGELGRLRHWDGTDWTRVAVTKTKFPFADALYGLWGKGPNDFWAVGDNVALHFDPTKKR